MGTDIEHGLSVVGAGAWEGGVGERERGGGGGVGVDMEGVRQPHGARHAPRAAVVVAHRRDRAAPSPS